MNSMEVFGIININGGYQAKVGIFFAQGILGQYVFVSPKKNLIIVRLGKNYGNIKLEKFISRYIK